MSPINHLKSSHLKTADNLNGFILTIILNTWPGNHHSDDIVKDIQQLFNLTCLECPSIWNVLFLRQPMTTNNERQLHSPHTKRARVGHQKVNQWNEDGPYPFDRIIKAMDFTILQLMAQKCVRISSNPIVGVTLIMINFVDFSFLLSKLHGYK